MNLLPILKCKLHEQRNLFWFGALICVSMFLPSLLLHNVSENSRKASSINMVVLSCVFAWAIVQMRVLIDGAGKEEYWYSLPFSKSQIFITGLLAQQTIALLVPFLFLVVCFLAGGFSEDSPIVSTVVNAVTLGNFLMIVSLFFVKPKKKGNLPALGWSALFFLMAFIIPIGFSAISFRHPGLGWWPTYFALPGIGLVLVALKRSIDKLEPTTWERPLFRPEMSSTLTPPMERIYATNRNGARHAPENPGIFEFALNTLLDKLCSPVTRCVAKTIWFNRRYALFFFFASFMAFGLVAGNSMYLFTLFFFCIFSMNVITYSSESIRVFSPLPIDSLRLFLLVFAPYFVMLTLVFLVPCCFWQDNKADSYVWLFIRGSLFFYFLLGMRLACKGGRLAELKPKYARGRAIRKSKTKESPTRQGGKRWKYWIEETVVIGLGGGVLLLTCFGMIPKFADFRTFLLDHYLACWVALIVAIVVFFRLSLQAFRRVY